VTLLPPTEPPKQGGDGCAAPKCCERGNTGGQERRGRWRRRERGSARQKRDRQGSENKTEWLHEFTLLFQQDHFNRMIKTLSK
jgi:hypothetical protein